VTTAPLSPRVSWLERSGALQLTVALGAAAFFSWAWVVYPIEQGHSGDFLGMLSHREASAGWWDGKGLGYGPIFALYDLLLRGLDDATAMRVMFVWNHLLLAATFSVLMLRFLPRPSRSEAVMAALLWVAFYPSFQTLRQNNIEITELFFLALMLWALGRGRRGLAGVALGLAGATKVLPLLLVPYFLWRRKWKVVGAAISTAFSALVFIVLLKHETLSIAWGQWSGHASLPFPNSFQNNQALSGFWWRVWSTFDLSSRWGVEHPRVYDATAAKIATWLSSGLLLAVVALALVKKSGVWAKAASPALEGLELAIATTSMVIVLPHNHTHYFVLSAWAYVAAIREWPRPLGRWGLAAIWLHGLSYVLLGLLVFWRALDPLIQRRWPITGLDLARLASFPLLGALASVAAMLIVHRHFVEPPSDESTTRVA
jgi:Glycosyltransferase family 87